MKLLTETIKSSGTCLLKSKWDISRVISFRFLNDRTSFCIQRCCPLLTTRKKAGVRSQVSLFRPWSNMPIYIQSTFLTLEKDGMWCSSNSFSKIWIHVQVMQHPHILKLQNMFRINYVCIYIKDCPKQVKLFKYFWVLCQLCILSRNIIKSFHDLVKTWFIQLLGGISSVFHSLRILQ